MRRPSRQERRPQDPRQDDIRPGIPPITIDETSIDENRLHPLGIPGINFLEPDLELVDPWDWFLTPAKGNDIGVDAIEITESSDGCVVCISARPTLLWLTAGSGGGTGFCYVKPECRRPPEPPPPPPTGTINEDNWRDFPPPTLDIPVKKGQLIEVTYQFISGDAYVRGVCKGNQEKTQFIPFTPGNLRYTVEAAFDGAITTWTGEWTDPATGTYRYKCPEDATWKNGTPKTDIGAGLKINGQDIQPGYLGISYSLGHNYTNGIAFSYWIWKPVIKVDGIPVDNTPPESDKPPPPPPPPEKEDMKCCRQNDDVIKLLRKVAKVTGVSELPVTLPASFNGKRTGTEKIETIPQFVQWNALQTSDLIGAYPKKITIEDANLLEEGNQKVEIELPNLSEAIADMYGQSVRSAATAEVLLAFATKLAAEICSVKAADLVTQSMVKSIAIAMGFKYNEEKTYVDFGFNFTEDASQVEDFLEPAEKKIITWRCEQEDSLWEYLQRLMFAASLVKAQTLRKETTGVGSALQRLVDAGLAGGTGLQEFIDKLNSEGFYNAKDGIKKPKIEELE